MDSPASDLKRDDALRKSIKKTKAPLAPLSPAPVRLADIDIGERPPLSLSPITAAAPPFKLFPSPLPKPKHFQVSTNFDSDKRSSVPAHMLASVKISSNDTKSSLFSQDELDDRSDALDLDSIQKQINAVEEIFHQQQLQSELQSSHRNPSIDELKIRSRRYGETENLLQPCGSNMASGTDFCYLPPMNDSDCEEEESGFQRGSEGRNSTGAKDFEKSAKNSKINRTSSDTKNFDYVGIRQTLREKQVERKQAENETKRKDVKELDDLLAKAAAKHNKRIPVPVSSSDEIDNGVSDIIIKPTIPTASSIILKRNEVKYAQNLRHFEDSIKKAKIAAQAEGKNKAKPAAPPVVTAVTPKVSKVPIVVKPTVPSTRHSISPPPVPPPSNNSTLPTRNNRLASAQVTFCFVYVFCVCFWKTSGFLDSLWLCH